MDEALEDLICSLETFDLEPEYLSEPSSNSHIKEATGTGSYASKAGQLDLATAPLELTAADSAEPVVEHSMSLPRKVLVNLVPQAGSGWVHVALTAISMLPAAPPSAGQPCTLEDHATIRKRVKGAAQVTVCMDVRPDDAVCVALRCQEKPDSVAESVERAESLHVAVQMSVHDSEQYVRVQLLTMALF